VQLRATRDRDDATSRDAPGRALTRRARNLGSISRILNMTANLIKNILCVSLAGAALLASAAPVVAAGQQEEPAASVRVSFADLDINKPAGAETLLKRIERAADAVCGEAPDPVARDFAPRQCRKDAVSRAVGRMNAPMLTAVANLRLAGH
jgi:UrcA family protein